MKTIKVKIRKSRVQVTGDRQNFTVIEKAGWDIGRPMGNGSNQEIALADFKADWMVKFDEEIEIKIV